MFLCRLREKMKTMTAIGARQMKDTRIVPVRSVTVRLLCFQIMCMSFLKMCHGLHQETPVLGFSTHPDVASKNPGKHFAVQGEGVHDFSHVDRSDTKEYASKHVEAHDLQHERMSGNPGGSNNHLVEQRERTHTSHHEHLSGTLESSSKHIAEQHEEAHSSNHEVMSATIDESSKHIAEQHEGAHTSHHEDMSGTLDESSKHIEEQHEGIHTSHHDDMSGTLDESSKPIEEKQEGAHTSHHDNMRGTLDESSKHIAEKHEGVHSSHHDDMSDIPERSAEQHGGDQISHHGYMSGTPENAMAKSHQRDDAYETDERDSLKETYTSDDLHMPNGQDFAKDQSENIDTDDTTNDPDVNSDDVVDPGDFSQSHGQQSKSSYGHDKSSDHGKHSDQKLVVLERMFKRNLGLSEGTATSPKRKRHINKYVWRLYSAMKAEGEGTNHDRGSDDAKHPPTLRSIRHLDVSESSGGAIRKVYRFPVPSRGLGKIVRLELVLNVGSLRLDSVGDGDRATIVIHTSGNGTETFEGTWFESYLVFDVSRLRDFFHLRLERSLVIGDHVKRIRRAYDPLLVLFENISYNPLFEGTERLKRSVESGSRWPQAAALVSESYTAYHCQRYDWQINMNFFRWQWYIQPDTYNAGFCDGPCMPVDSEVLNSTNYSFIKGLFHVITSYTEEIVPRECCTPVAYSSEVIVYYDENVNVVIRRLPNMKVTACGCR